MKWLANFWAALRLARPIPGSFSLDSIAPSRLDGYSVRCPAHAPFLKPSAHPARDTLAWHSRPHALSQSFSVERMRLAMTEPHSTVKSVTGPDGSPLTLADLPSPVTKRWVIRCKAEVVAAVRGGLLSLEEACGRYTLTAEEFLAWQSSIDRHGLAGLRATRIQLYRQRTAGTGVFLGNGRFRRRYRPLRSSDRKD